MILGSNLRLIKGEDPFRRWNVSLWLKFIADLGLEIKEKFAFGKHEFFVEFFDRSTCIIKAKRQECRFVAVIFVQFFDTFSNFINIPNYERDERFADTTFRYLWNLIDLRALVINSTLFSIPAGLADF